MISTVSPELEAPLLPLPRVDSSHTPNAVEAVGDESLKQDASTAARCINDDERVQCTTPSAATAEASVLRGAENVGTGRLQNADDWDASRRLPSRVWRTALLAGCGLVAVLAAATCFEVAAFRRACVEVTVSFKSDVPGVDLTQMQDPSFRNRFQTHYARELLRAAKSPGASVSFQGVDKIATNRINGIRILASIHFLRRDEVNGE